MAFNSYEELQAAVEKRRKSLLTLEVDLGGEYSQEHEDAKTELKQAKAMQALTGSQGFLADNLAELELRVAETKPETNTIWIQYSQLDLGAWALLIKQSNLTPVDQYEKVLVETFIGVFGVDPVEPDEATEGWEAPAALSTDPRLLSSKSGKGILPGGALHQVVQAFMNWQNSGGDVNIRPTKSGRA